MLSDVAWDLARGCAHASRFRAAFRPGSDRGRLPGYIESRCVKRCHPRFDLRSTEICGAMPSLQATNSASAPPLSWIGLQRAGLRPKRCSLDQAVALTVRYSFIASWWFSAHLAAQSVTQCDSHRLVNTASNLFAEKSIRSRVATGSQPEAIVGFAVIGGHCRNFV
jgi:hypothetical protein